MGQEVDGLEPWLSRAGGTAAVPAPRREAVGLLRLPRESRGEVMPESSLKDKNYDLVNVLHASLHNVWMLEEYIRDAEKEGDQELAHWFKRIQENNVKAGEQGKEMLVKRLSNG
jgi:hypothetical protein